MIKPVKPPKTYDELVARENELKIQLEVKKNRLRAGFHAIKEEFSPASNLFAFFQKFVTRDQSNRVVTMGVNMGVDLLVKRMLLARAGWLPRMVIPYLIKNYSTHFITGNGFVNGNGSSRNVEQDPTVFHRLGRWLKSS